MRHIKNKQKHEADEYILNQAVPNSQKEKDQWSTFFCQLNTQTVPLKN